MKKINLESVVCFILIVVMLLIPILKFCTYVPSINNFFITVFDIRRVYVLWGSLIFLVIIYLFSLFSGKNKINYVDIILYLLIFLAFVSTTYAIDFEKSFYGEMYRDEGLITILSYYFLLLNARILKNDKYKKVIVKLFIVIGVFQSLYCILQSYTDLPFIRRFSISYMAMGLCSNPNFFGSYMVMQLLLVGFMYVYSSRKIYLFLYLLFGISLYSAESTGPVLSVVASLVLALFIFRDKFKEIFKILLILLFVFIITDKTINYVQNNFYKQELVESYDISSDVSTILEKPVEEVGSGRLVVWNNSLPLVKKYWLFGCGLDNFKEVYPHIGNLKFDKAHNVYLQMGITNGLPALIIYLILMFICFIKGLKLKNSLFVPIYMAFIGYCIQAFFNISVIDVAPYFYIITGLILSDYSKKCVD